MALTILGRSPRIAKRWPHTILNILSSRQIQKFLVWKSKGHGVKPPFRLENALLTAQRVQIFLPDSLPEILIAVPVLLTLKHELAESKLQLIAIERFKPFLESLFGPNSVIGLMPEDFFWGEAHFKDLQSALRDFQPQLLLNFRPITTPLLDYLIRLTPASLCVQVIGQEQGSYANITFKCEGPGNHLRRLLRVTSLWNFTDWPLKCKWTRLKPGPEHVLEASKRLAALGLRPENSQIFLWQSPTSPFQNEVLRNASAACQSPGSLKSLVILWTSAAPFSDSAPPDDAFVEIPRIEVESIGLLLGFFEQTPLTIGLHGALLHLASLTDTDVEAHFQEEDAPWDTSFLNPRMRVIYRNGNQESLPA